MTYKDWTRQQRSAVGYAFQAWVENQWDDMQAGGGQDADELNRLSQVASDLVEVYDVPELPELTPADVEAIEDSVWNILDDSGSLPGEEWWSDEVDPADLREAMRVAGWAESWGQPD